MSFLEQTDAEGVCRDSKGNPAAWRDNLELIASENVVSEAVLEAQGSVMTNKYAEGYPGKRYYGGCEFVDEVESLAIARAKELFGADHANVQPHSGSQANMTVYLSVLETREIAYLGMNLAHGGHLSMGSPVNFSGFIYQVIPYGVSEKTETIDYDEVERLAKEHRPKLIVAGASAYPRIIDYRAFSPDRRRDRRALDGRYGAYRRLGCRRIASEPGSLRRFRHDDDAQDAARVRAAAWCCAKPSMPKPSTAKYFPACRAVR